MFRNYHWLAICFILTSIVNAHTPLLVIVDTVVDPPRLIIAPSSLPTLAGEVDMNFAPAGPYAGLYVTDLPSYDTALFPFSQFPTVNLRLERVEFAPGFGMFRQIGSTEPILESDGDMRSVVSHSHFIHFCDQPGAHKVSFRYVDASGQLGASSVFTITFRAARPGFDTDSDGVFDMFDNCVDDPNADQIDSDGDTVGDECDGCPDDANRSQLDLNDDGVCDACNCDDLPCAQSDVNYDGFVDLLDLIQTRNAASQNLFPPIPPANLRMDINDDDKIDTADLVEIRAAWN